MIALSLTAAPAVPDGWLDAVDVSQISAWSIVGIFVLAILRGWLVPRRTLMEIRDVKDAQLARQDNDIKSWRESSEMNAAALVKSQGQVDDLLDVGRTTRHVLTSLSEAADGRNE